jgi:uncharacterized membrane protein YagU involved in acid resistance
MWGKVVSGVLPEFNPYVDLQRTITWTIGAAIPQSLFWTVSFLNGALVVSFVFHRIYYFLPGQGPFWKGLLFGVLAWAIMASVVFPLIGEGFLR